MSNEQLFSNEYLGTNSKNHDILLAVNSNHPILITYNRVEQFVIRFYLTELTIALYPRLLLYHYGRRICLVETIKNTYKGQEHSDLSLQTIAMYTDYASTYRCFHPQLQLQREEGTQTGRGSFSNCS